MVGVDEKTCQAQHRALGLELKGIHESQAEQHTLLMAIDGKIDVAFHGNGVVGGKPGMIPTIESNRTWIKRFLVILGAVLVAALTTLTTLTVTYLWKGDSNEVRQPISGTVHVDPAN